MVNITSGCSRSLSTRLTFSLDGMMVPLVVPLGTENVRVPGIKSKPDTECKER